MRELYRLNASGEPAIASRRTGFIPSVHSSMRPSIRSRLPPFGRGLRSCLSLPSLRAWSISSKREISPSR